jgi:prepilin-type N-terminal cleavage/methylation domain-containing protein
VRKRLAAARKNQDGFTLIELLIVIVILGILAGIVVFAVGAFNDRGEKAACQAEKKSVEVAVEAYRAKFSNYPATGTTAGNIGKLVDPDNDPLTPDGFLRDGNVAAVITLSDGGAVGGVC